MQLYFIFFGIIEPILVILKIEYCLSRRKGGAGGGGGGEGGVCSLANYNVAYEETQSNRFSDFRDFVCSLFPKAIFFFYFYIRFQTEQVSEMKNDCLCRQINFYLANRHGRGENLKANMAADQNVSFFSPRKGVLTEFALMLRYEIDINLVRTLLSIFPIHTKLKYQFQVEHLEECKRYSGDLELNV